eukprot:364563-Chlamydomonas_euryale.AAC.2
MPSQGAGQELPSQRASHAGHCLRRPAQSTRMKQTQPRHGLQHSNTLRQSIVARVASHIC